MENKNAEYISKAESTENLESEQKRLLLERMNIENRHKNGANWFYWIAGLSLINSIIRHRIGNNAINRWNRTDL